MKTRIFKYGTAIWLLATVSAALLIPVKPDSSSYLFFPDIPGLGEKIRLLFFHVPAAWISVLAFFLSMANGIRFLKTDDRKYDVRSSSLAELGFFFCVLATATGAIWAKFNWGAFWNWDPRQISIFILLLIYGAYFVLRSAVEAEDKKAKLSAVYSILAFATVPFLVFILPRVSTGLHPGSDGRGPVSGFDLDSTIFAVFLSSLVGFTFLFFIMYQLRCRVGYIESNAGANISSESDKK